MTSLRRERRAKTQKRYHGKKNKKKTKKEGRISNKKNRRRRKEYSGNSADIPYLTYSWIESIIFSTVSVWLSPRQLNKK